MKMLRAIIRPDRDIPVTKALEKAGIFALTKIPVTGRGAQGGVQNGPLGYSELSKLMLMLVLPEEQVDVAITAIAHAAYTGYPGDGRIFISDVEKTVRLRTGEIHDSSLAKEASR